VGHAGEQVMWIIKLLFWRFFDKPKVGERYVHNEDVNLPWKRLVYTVKDVSKQHVLFEYQYEDGDFLGSTSTREVACVVAFFTKLESAQ
jgi:hypothetical protein